MKSHVSRRYCLWRRSSAQSSNGCSPVGRLFMTAVPPDPEHDASGESRELFDDALIRTHLANERTFLAWLRSAVVLLGVGLGAVALGGTRDFAEAGALALGGAGRSSPPRPRWSPSPAWS